MLLNMTINSCEEKYRKYDVNVSILIKEMFHKLFFVLCVEVFFFDVFLCTICVLTSHRGQRQKKALDPLELELRICLSCHISSNS